jgi:hypothetical protein
VAVWGIGFKDRAYTLTECNALIDSLKKYGNTVMVGIPTYWRTFGNDAVPDTMLHTIIKKSDIVSPWFVGRYSSLNGILDHTANVTAPDVQWCKQYGKDYLPVVFPGFSWHNMYSTSPLNQIPRLGGEFLWKQFYEYIRVGSTMIYQAMFDEIDEATAIFKCTNDPPVGASTFVTYEGLPSDHYLWLVGEGRRMLKNQIPLSSTLPTRSVGVDKQDIESPREFKLNQNYPNPFNPSTKIEFSVTRDGYTTLIVYNILGQPVATLYKGVAQTGKIYRCSFEGLSLPTGVYLSRLESGKQSLMRKMVLTK